MTLNPHENLADTLMDAPLACRSWQIVSAALLFSACALDRTKTKTVFVLPGPVKSGPVSPSTVLCGHTRAQKGRRFGFEGKAPTQACF